jgi:uridine kinase
MEQYYFGKIIRLKKNYVLVTLSNDEKNLITKESLSYLVKESQVSEKNKQFKDLVESNKIKYKGSLSSDYAIIHKKMISMLFVMSEIDTVINQKEKVNIAIDGHASSGKTTLSSMLKEVYDCNIFHIDDFFKKPEINQNEPYSIYGSNIDFQKIKENIFNQIEKEEDIMYQELDLSTHQHKKPIMIPYKKLNIIEGSFSMHPRLIHYYDLKIFVKLRYLSQLRRIRKRNGFIKLFEFKTKWIPNENKYFKDLDIINQADLSISLKIK